MQDPQDVRALDVHQHGRRRARHGVEHLRGERLEEAQRGIRRGDDRALEHVLELAHVPGPVVGAERLEDALRNRVDPPLMLPRQPVHQVTA